jgi:hypothetical protein
VELRSLEAAPAKEFIKRWHYAHSATAGVLCYGLFADDGELLGVSIYNNGFRDMQAGVFGPEHADRVIHHHRLAISESAREQGVKVSQFIGMCNRKITEDRPDLWALVTYADTTFGNSGAIYRATNALFTGTQSKGNVYFVTPEGEFRSVSKSLSKGWDPSQGGTDWSARLEEAARRDWKLHRSNGRNRYVYLLGNKAERRVRRAMLRWPVLPYTDISRTDGAS